jgi:uncharacterized protein YdhG (YjbR/CyaY superfamily)
MTKAEDATARIDAMLAGLPADQRTALQSLRETIAAAAPEAVETMSYGAPAIAYRGHPLVSYGAAKGHCSFYVMSPAVIVAHAAEVEGYGTSKGAIRFTPARPLPVELVTAIVRERMAETDARWGAKAQ